MSNNNSVLVFVNTSRAWGGLEMNTIQLAKWMAQQMNVLIACQEHSPIAEKAIKQDIPIVYVEKKKTYFPIRASLKLKKIIKKWNAHHILFCDNKDMSYCCWAKFFSSDIRLYYQQHMQIGKHKKDFIHTIRYRMLDAWISPLLWLAEEVKQKTNINPKKVHTIPLGLETEKLLQNSITKEEAKTFWNLETEYPVIGIIGRLDRQKNQHLLIEAVKRLKEQQIFITLLIVGEPTKEPIHQDYAEELRKLVKDAEIEDRVYFHPFTNQIAAFYSALDVFVMATNRETYGMVTIESILYGTPVIASNSGGSPEILKQGEYGTLFEQGNIDDLTEKIKYVLTNSEQIQQKAAKAKEHIIEYFDYQSECEKIMDLIRKIN